MFEECIVLGNGFFMKICFSHGEQYRLSVIGPGKLLVEYKGEGGRHGRAVRGRAAPYEFKSVEKLRYDFERDAEDALRQG
jgi:hypothetical protein